MIVQLRIEIDDADRNKLSVATNPKAGKRLATRNEVLEAVTNAWEAEFKRLATSTKQAQAPQTMVKTTQEAAIDIEEAPKRTNRGPKDTMYHVNNAMFAMSSAQRMRDDASIHDAMTAIIHVRDQLVQEIEKE